jgi:hypothetical protein
VFSGVGNWWEMKQAGRLAVPACLAYVLHNPSPKNFAYSTSVSDVGCSESPKTLSAFKENTTAKTGTQQTFWMCFGSFCSLTQPSTTDLAGQLFVNTQQDADANQLR